MLPPSQKAATHTISAVENCGEVLLRWLSIRRLSPEGGGGREILLANQLYRRAFSGYLNQRCLEITARPNSALVPRLQQPLFPAEGRTPSSITDGP
jgi:hypothetical protein